jgi:hypothetical protein
LSTEHHLVPTSSIIKLNPPIPHLHGTVVPSSFAWLVTDFSLCPVTHISNPEEEPTVRFMIFSMIACLKISLTFPLLPSHSCCFRPQTLMLLLHFGCTRHLTSSRVLVLQVFGVQRCPCLVPCAVQEWRSRSTVCGQRPTSVMTHHGLGSISLAVNSSLWLDAGPYTSPTMPR